MTKRVLVVDDEPDLVTIVSALLEAEGYEVEAASDGIEAIESAQATPPDLILMDVMMPEMNGYQACRLLKNNPLTRHIPVIMLTAKAYQSDRYQGMDSGADEYLTKPYEDDRVIALVRSFLGA